MSEFTSSHGRHQGKGVQEEAISKGMELDSQGLFSRDKKQELLFLLMILHCTLTVSYICM